MSAITQLILRVSLNYCFTISPKNNYMAYTSLNTGTNGLILNEAYGVEILFKIYYLMIIY